MDPVTAMTPLETIMKYPGPWLAWILPMILSLVAFSWGFNPIFLVLPEWIVSVVMYIVFSYVQQKMQAMPESV